MRGCSSQHFDEATAITDAPPPTTFHQLIPGPSPDTDRRRFRDELVALGQGLKGDLIVDVSLLPQLTSDLLGTLALFAQTLPAGSRAVLLAPNPTVRTVLLVTNFDLVIPVAETMDEARAMLAGIDRQGSGA